MIPRIKSIETLSNLRLRIVFDDEKTVEYDVSEDVKELPGYQMLESEKGLFEKVQVDESRTVIFWNDEIDLPSDILYEYGRTV